MKIFTAAVVLALSLPGLALAQGGGSNANGSTGAGTTSGGDSGMNGSANTRGAGTGGTNSGAASTTPSGQVAGTDSGARATPPRAAQRHHTRARRHASAGTKSKAQTH